MRTRLEWKWEKLDEYNSRVQVIGGWLLSNIFESKGKISISNIFVEDKEHKWEIKQTREKKGEDEEDEFDPNTWHE